MFCAKKVTKLPDLTVHNMSLSSLQMPKFELHRPGIEPGPPALQAGTLPQYMPTYSYKETHLTRNNTQQHKRTCNNRQQHTTTVDNSTLIHKITNVPLFKKLWDIIISRSFLNSGTLIVIKVPGPFKLTYKLWRLCRKASPIDWYHSQPPLPFPRTIPLNKFLDSWILRLQK
jgi:hypothetical protein